MSSLLSERLGKTTLLLAVSFSFACGGTEPAKDPTIAFDQVTYSVALNSTGTAVVSKPMPSLTFTQGSDPLPTSLSIGLDPSGSCGASGGVAFPFNSAKWTLLGSEASQSSVIKTVDFNVCGASNAGQTIPRGTTVIHATWSIGAKTFTATASVIVQ